MNVINIDEFNISGFALRTKNELEMNSESRRIPGLWNRFFSELVPKFKESSTVYGVYTNYESDHSGEFDVFAGADVLSNYEDTNKVTVESGKYLVFEKEGEMPQTVIDLWYDIWKIFEKDDCAYTRQYKTDFEKYIGSSKVVIYIGIK